jgi:hypothetical protein
MNYNEKIIKLFEELKPFVFGFELGNPNTSLMSAELIELYGELKFIFVLRGGFNNVNILYEQLEESISRFYRWCDLEDAPVQIFFCDGAPTIETSYYGIIDILQDLPFYWFKKHDMSYSKIISEIKLRKRQKEILVMSSQKIILEHLNKELLSLSSLNSLEYV